MYCIIAKFADEWALADHVLFAELSEAREAAANMAGNPCPATWHGKVGTDEDGRTVALWGWGLGQPVSPGALVLPLPERASGCRPEHAPLLDEARYWLGGGLPLDALAADGEDPEAWEIIDETPRVVSVTMRADFDGDSVSRWISDESCQDSGGPWPEAIDLSAIVEAADSYAADNYDAPSEENGDEEGDEGPTVYLAISSDGEIIDAFDSEDDAEEAAARSRDESRYGYPWAWNWAHYIDNDHPEVTADLQAAGFTVARQSSTGYLFAGIDGGGYDFKSAHHVKLAALRMARRGGTTPDGAIPVGPPIK